MTPLILAATLTLIAANDTTQTAAAPTPPAPAAKPKDDPDKIVCKTEQVTGSRFNQKVCMTKGQWDDAEKNSERVANYLQSQTGVGHPSGGGYGGQ